MPPSRTARGAATCAATSVSALVGRLRQAAAGSTGSRGASAVPRPDLRIYGLTRCLAAGISCADCRRCLGGALAVVEREYNGSAGMQVLRLSCMARYESYPFYNTKSLARRSLASAMIDYFPLNVSSSFPASVGGVQPTPAPPGGRNPSPSPPAQARASPAPAAPLNISGPATATPRAAQPTPAPPGGRTRTPQHAAAATNGNKNGIVIVVFHSFVHEHCFRLSVQNCRVPTVCSCFPFGWFVRSNGLRIIREQKEGNFE